MRRVNESVISDHPFAVFNAFVANVSPINAFVTKSEDVAESVTHPLDFADNVADD